MEKIDNEMNCRGAKVCLAKHCWAKLFIPIGFPFMQLSVGLKNKKISRNPIQLTSSFLNFILFYLLVVYLDQWSGSPWVPLQPSSSLAKFKEKYCYFRLILNWHFTLTFIK
jgi:prolipoprotein diacylglyceryltransferase